MNKTRRLWRAVFTGLALATAFTINGFAAERDTEARLTFSLLYTNKSVKTEADDTFTYAVKPLDGAPLPISVSATQCEAKAAGTKDGVFLFTLQGRNGKTGALTGSDIYTNDNFTLDFTIPFSAPENYSYTIYSWDKSSDPQTNYTYTAEGLPDLYKFTVYVYNSSDGLSYTTEINAWNGTDTGAAKVSSIEFDPSYADGSKTNPGGGSSNSGGGSGSGGGSAVIRSNTVPLGTVTIDDGTTPEGDTPEGVTIDEGAVPLGTLPKTGENSLLVSWVAMAGMFLLVIGILMMIGRKRNAEE